MKLPFDLPTRATVAGIWAAARGVVLFAVLAALIVQTVRIEGVRFWPFAIEGLAAKVERLAGENAAMIAGQALAEERQRAEMERAATDYLNLAKEIDDGAKSQMDLALRGADAFIAAGGVRAATVDCPSGGAGAPAQNHRAGHPARTGGAAQLDAAATGRPPADPALAAGVSATVAVLARDVRVCTVNTVKAETAHDWGMGLEALSE